MSKMTIPINPCYPPGDQHPPGRGRHGRMRCQSKLMNRYRNKKMNPMK